MELHVAIARHVFGWQWRDEGQAWYPPDWPSLSIINAPRLDKLRALEQHGGKPYGHAGGIDDRGRPVIPQYQYDPDAGHILWEWLYAQPGMTQVRFAPLAPPAGSLPGVTPWRCTITHEAGAVVTGEGNGHQEALCYAVLELAAPSLHRS